MKERRGKKVEQKEKGKRRKRVKKKFTSTSSSTMGWAAVASSLILDW